MSGRNRWRHGLPLLVLLAAACAGSRPTPAAYTFHPDDAPVRVDSPALRALKAQAHIAGCPVTPRSARPVPGGLPAMTLPCLGGGRSVDLAGLRGPLVLNFWAQSCDPCRSEAPLFQHLSATAGSRVRVIGVDFYDLEPARALGFAASLGLTYPQLADPAAAARALLHVAGIPVTLFVDGAGRVTYSQVGPVTSAGELAALVKSHLGVTVPGSGT